MLRNCMSPASRIRIAADVHRQSTSDDDSGCILEEYAWIPMGLKPDMIHRYFTCLPDHKVPYVNSVGEKWRNRQLVNQLPPQDSDTRYCASLSKDESNELMRFEEARKTECLGRGVIKQLPYDGKTRHCHQCRELVAPNSIAVYAPDRFGDKCVWHPACFVCAECQELLVDLIYFRHNDAIFCGRHHAEQAKPRCARCDELIFSIECTEAEGRVWHMHHFICDRCECRLGGQKYIVKDGQSLCIGCYHDSSNLICNTCKQQISPEHPHITQSDVHWHAKDTCFCCSKCQKNLLGKKYTFTDSRLFCYGSCSKPDKLRLRPTNQQLPPSKPSSSRSLRELPSPLPAASRSRPRPPQRHPPPAPAPSSSPENVYETLEHIDVRRSCRNMPCSSSHESISYREGRLRHCGSEKGSDYWIPSSSSCTSESGLHRARSHPRRIPPRDLQKKSSMTDIKPQNYYSRMPPSPMTLRGEHYRCSSCSSSSDSEGEEPYFGTAFVNSLPQIEQLQNKRQIPDKNRTCRRVPVIVKSRTAKSKKSSSNCIVS
ncbi:hypothetical protein QR680_002962 [Steinernema hermaphroditum]|uniref:PET domain-containing protein n=1 Tax=Steinernema hermaphroditum TaxID=289476 RepID=A0AA39H5Q6_9BILA|nr:hypothetical protein QR680_002962 [Steinernema hermaphroditum]